VNFAFFFLAATQSARFAPCPASLYLLISFWYDLLTLFPASVFFLLIGPPEADAITLHEGSDPGIRT